jgi:hypothetical protein
MLNLRWFLLFLLVVAPPFSLYAGDYSKIPNFRRPTHSWDVTMRILRDNCANFLKYHLMPSEFDQDRAWSEKKIGRFLDSSTGGIFVLSEEEWAQLRRVHGIVRDLSPLLSLLEDYRGPRDQFVELLEWFQNPGQIESWLEYEGMESLKKLWAKMKADGWRVVPVYRELTVDQWDISHTRKKIFIRMAPGNQPLPIVLALAIYDVYLSYLIDRHETEILAILNNDDSIFENFDAWPALYLSFETTRHAAVLKIYEKLVAARPQFKVRFWDEHLILSQPSRSFSQYLNNTRAKPLPTNAVQFIIREKFVLSRFDWEGTPLGGELKSDR